MNTRHALADRSTLKDDGSSRFPRCLGKVLIFFCGLWNSLPIPVSRLGLEPVVNSRPYPRSLKKDEELSGPASTVNE